MKSFKQLLTALAALVAVTALAPNAPVFAGSTGNPNDPAYWESQLGDGASCVKHDPGDTTADGAITDGGTSVTLDAGDWALLVVNSGAGGPDGNGNLVYDNPVPGIAYFGPLNGGGQQGNVSHWIVCGTPTAPQPEPMITHTAWIDGAWECGDTTVEQTRTVTTTPYVLVDDTWQLDDANAVTETETQTRTLTADELATCVPDQPEPMITHTAWVDGAWECGDTTVEQTRTTTVTNYVLVNGEWQLDDANAVTETETQTRTLTADELATCVPDQPEPIITHTAWIDGAWECGDTTVEQTRTTTVTNYVLVNGEWQLDDADAEVTSETRTRALNADEQFSCDVLVATQSPTFVDPTCTADAAIILPETAGVAYATSGPAAAGATVTVSATAQPGYVVTGSTEWTHIFGTVDESQCVDSGAVPPTTENPTTETPTTTTDPVVGSDAATTTLAPTTQLPKTGSDRLGLVALVAALLLGGGVALSTAAARRRS